jgi:hypothetical protein
MANKKVSQLTSKPSVLTTDLFPIADPSTGQLFKTTISDLGTAIGSGVSSVNSLVGAVVLDTDDIQELVSPTNKWFTDTRARAALSASSPLTYNSGTGAFGIQVATGSQNGYLSSADWTTFNSKQAALSGTGFVKSTGGTISYDTNTYLTTSAAASTYLALGGGTLTGTLIGTRAEFTTSTLVDGVLVNNGSGRGIRVNNSGAGYGIIINNETASSAIPFLIQKNGTNKISFTDAGGATYSDRINTPTLYATGSSSESAITINQNSGYHALSITQSGVGNAIYATGAVTITGTTYVGGQLTLGSTISNLSGYTYTLPSATGTLALTSDLSSYLPLSGGTLTGALSGTSATFSGNLNQNAPIFIDNSNHELASFSNNNLQLFFSSIYDGTNIIAKSGAGGRLIMNGGAFTFQTFGGATIGNVVTPIQRFNIANDGAATFSSSVTATSGILSGNLFMQAAAGIGTFITFKNDSNTDGFDIGHLNGGGAGAYIYQRANQPIIIGTNNAERMRITSSGNVGIGTTAPDRDPSGTRSLAISGGGSLAASLDLYGNGGRNYAIFTGGAGALGFFDLTAGSERMRITSAGSVLVGTTSDNGAGKLQVDGLIVGSTFAASQTLTVNANNEKKSGMYRWNDSSTNLPEAGFFSVVIYGNCDNVVAQMATHFQNANTYVRAFNTSWTAWRRII